MRRYSTRAQGHVLSRAVQCVHQSEHAPCRVRPHG
jgi:hypothetical protein